MNGDSDLEPGLAAAFGGARSVLARLDPTGALARGVALVPEAGDPRPVAPAAGAEGRYRIVGEIARGGVGVVLKGHDVDLGRDVALKVLRDEHAGDAGILHRFVEEAQIGGQLQHPGIVPVYELGIREDRRPFFAMKLVKGRTLASLLADRVSADAEKRRFLGIFEAVCQTMAYAHSRGVIHRDLKPSNVMVGAFGEVLVVDWGMGKVLRRGGVADERRPPAQSVIATARSGSGSTQSLVGSILGTPAYMPPEQARGEIERVDERADVFSLGGILLEILTGKPPYVGDEIAKAARADLGEALDRLRAAAPEPELETLCRACLAPAPEARPRTASEVASGIARFFASIDERARNARLAAARAKARVEGERRRRRLTVALAAAILALVAIAGGGFLWTERSRREREARVAAAVDAAIGEATLAEGAERWDEARDAAKRALAVSEARGAGGATLARARECLGRISSSARAAARRAEEEARDRALLERLDRLRATSVGRERYAEKDGWYAAAFRERGFDFDASAPETLAAAIRARPVAMALVLAIDYWAFLAPPERLRVLRAVGDSIDRDPWRLRLRHADSREELLRLADEAQTGERPTASMVILSKRLWVAGEGARSVELLRAVWRRDPGDFWVNHQLGWVPESSGKGPNPDAVRFATAAVALRPDNVLAWEWLGSALHADGEVRNSEACFRRCLELSRDSYVAHGMLSQIAGRSPGDVSEALRHAREAVRIAPTEPLPRVALGVALKRGGDPAGAIAACRAAIDLDPGNAAAHRHLGSLLAEAGEMAEARAAYREAMRLDPGDANVHRRLVVDLIRRQEWTEALVCVRTAIDLFPADMGLQLNLSRILQETGDAAGAVEAARAGLRLEPESASARGFLGSALLGSGETEEAVEVLREAVELDESIPEDHLNLAMALSRLGREREALETLRRLDALALELPPGTDLPAFLRWQEGRARLEERLKALGAGAAAGLGAHERAALASIACAKTRFPLAANLWIGLVEPGGASADPSTGWRLNAACCAALAGDGRGSEPVRPAERSAWRRRAVTWLRADLDLWRDAPASNRPAAAEHLRLWVATPDLASLRDRVDFLPPDERETCRALWRDVHALLGRIDPPR